jgi:hypothetical protein
MAVGSNLRVVGGGGGQKKPVLVGGEGVGPGWTGPGVQINIFAVW